MIEELLDLCRPLHDRHQENGNPVRSGGRLMGGTPGGPATGLRLAARSPNPLPRLCDLAVCIHPAMVLPHDAGRFSLPGIDVALARRPLLTNLDFTSSLYLELRHPREALAPFRQLTTGVPAAVRSPAEADDLAGSLGRLMGCSAAILGTTTLHIFWDLFCILCRPERTPDRRRNLPDRALGRRTSRGTGRPSGSSSGSRAGASFEACSSMEPPGYPPYHRHRRNLFSRGPDSAPPFLR